VITCKDFRELVQILSDAGVVSNTAFFLIAVDCDEPDPSLDDLCGKWAATVPGAWPTELRDVAKDYEDGVGFRLTNGPIMSGAEGVDQQAVEQEVTEPASP